MNKKLEEDNSPFLKRYFIKHTKDGDIPVTEFDFTKNLFDGRVEQDGYIFYHEDFGNGQYFGGAGYLANPDEYFKEMKPYEVTKTEFEKVMMVTEKIAYDKQLEKPNTGEKS